ncbi:hypothetical protein [Streptacidiphilus fuscans]|uniref:Uncharacterized protein n=1 Tax=Streptacidiphilus fuscans TaxID=2789292 RepID=A0A931B0T8_9ACTN|nr:hypothetical protein [Streptacidiphilus fuscans]MBF9069070.1 hypothetical protein [Streptacidiphilus fuscans]
MRKRFRAAIGAAALGIVLVSAGTAQADTTDTNGRWAEVTQTTASGWATADLQFVDGAGNPINSKTTPAFAQATFFDTETGYTLNGWLERSTDGGRTWYQESGIHALSSTGTTESTTDPYYDGPGYLARACFQFTSWSGAAVHCSPAI